MPELPEVETIRRVLVGWIAGRQVVDAASDYSAVLAMLLRMRQACAHSSLVPEELRQGFDSVLQLGEEEVAQLKSSLSKMKESLAEQDECCVCLDDNIQENAVITACLHVFW